MQNIYGLKSIGERVKKIRILRGMTQEELAQKSGLTQNAIQMLENNPTRGSKKIVEISIALGVNPKLVQLGKGYYPYSEDGKIIIPDGNVPVFTFEQINNHHDFIKNIEITENNSLENFLALPERANPNCFGIIIEDSSMTTSGSDISFQPGDRVLIDPDIHPENEEYVIAHLKDKNSTVLRQYRKEMGSYYLKPHDTSYEKIIVDENVKIIGVVLEKYEKIRHM